MPVTHLFTRQEYDPGSELMYYGARYYDPAIGRFITADTIMPTPMNTQAYNRYAYVWNNPVVYTDPSGHIPALDFAFGKFDQGMSFTFNQMGAGINNMERNFQDAYDTFRRDSEAAKYVWDREAKNEDNQEELSFIVAGMIVGMAVAGVCTTGAGCVAGVAFASAFVTSYLKAKRALTTTTHLSMPQNLELLMPL